MITTKPDTFIVPPCLNEIDILFQDEHLLFVSFKQSSKFIHGKRKNLKQYR